MRGCPHGKSRNKSKLTWQWTLSHTLGGTQGFLSVLTKYFLNEVLPTWSLYKSSDFKEYVSDFLQVWQHVAANFVETDFFNINVIV